MSLPVYRKPGLLLLGILLLAGAIAYWWMSAGGSAAGPQAPFPVRWTEDRLVDHSHLGTNEGSYGVVQPGSTAEVAAVMAHAHEHQLPVRVRGRAHSMNQATLPVDEELLLLTTDLNRYEFLSGPRLRVGAGARAHDVQRMLESKGLGLPVVNDGGFGPSVGGFIAAGGFGVGSMVWGGFWENVDEITFVDGTGAVHVLDREHEDFPWIFGSMGQWGIITEAVLDIAATHSLASYPLGETGRIEELPAEHPLMRAHQREYDNPKYWFSMFLQQAHLPKARRQLEELMAGYRSDFHFRPLYEYRIETRRFNPPLVFPFEGPFHVVGIWGNLASADRDVVYELEADFMALVASEPGYRRYIQSEVTAPDTDYGSYFGPELFGRFQALKDAYDPQGLLNRGVIFPH